MEKNRFLSNAWKGNKDPLLQVLAIMLTWMVWALLGGGLLFLPVIYLQFTDPDQAAAYLSDPMNFKLLKIDLIWVFLLIMGQFVVGLVGVWFAEKFLLRKRFLWVLTGSNTFRSKRFLAGLGFWMALMAAYQFLGYVLDPNSVKLGPDVGRFFLFVPLALIFVPLQSAFEEVAIRGQLLQGLIRLTPTKPYLPLLLSSLIFALLHGMNSEIQAYGAALMMLHYFTFGAVLGAFALMDEGLELSIGIHAGNNIFSLCLVSYPGASLSTPALLEQQSMEASADYLVMLAFVVLMYFVFFGKRRNAWKAIFQNIRTGATESVEQE